VGRSLSILAVFTVIAVLARPQRGRHWEGLHGWPWLVVGLGLQILWVRILAGHTTSLSWLPCLGLISALRFVWLNRRYRGLQVLAIGACLNLLVMAGNGGLMPIAPRTLYALGMAGGRAGVSLALSKNYVLGDGVTRLAFLDDRLVAVVAGVHMAGSVGDLLVVMGCLVTLGEELWHVTHATAGSRLTIAT